MALAIAPFAAGAARPGLTPLVRHQAAASAVAGPGERRPGAAATNMHTAIERPLDRYCGD
jgi:hypothetical protein